MKPPEVFAIVVRTVGLLLCLGAGGSLFWGVAFGGPASVFGLAIVGVPMLVVGLWLLRGAPSLIAFAFPSGRHGRHWLQAAQEVDRLRGVRSGGEERA